MARPGDYRGIEEAGRVELVLRGERRFKPLFWSVLLIGLHSMTIGIFIFFFTETFYKIFFLAEIENFFFVRQAGLFLFCLGFFNVAVLSDLEKNIFFVKVIIATKCLAFLFLVFQAHLSVHPFIIYVASLGDGAMAVLLMVLLRRAGVKGGNRST